MAKSSRIKYNIEQIKEIVLFAETAPNVQDVEEKFSASWSNLYRACKRNGIKIKKQKNINKNSPIKLVTPKIIPTPEIIAEFKSCASISNKSTTHYFKPYPTDVTAYICGDPTPERSALYDKYK